MELTSIRVKKIEGNDPRLLGFASVVIDKEFIIEDIKIIQGKERLFLSMPNQKMPDGKYRDLVHPLNSECRRRFEEAILSEYDNCK